MLFSTYSDHMIVSDLTKYGRIRALVLSVALFLSRTEVCRFHAI